MRKLQFVTLALLLCSQLALAQQSALVHRVGDAIRGPVKVVRSEISQYRSEENQQIEGPPTLIQIVTYRSDGRSREIQTYNADGSPRQKTIESYRSDGNREAMAIFDREDKIITRMSYEYSVSGRPLSETRYHPDGSVKDKKFTQVTGSDDKIAAVARISGNGTQIETSVNTRDEASKTSTWTTTKPDGGRSDQIASRDGAGNHITETLSYSPDGSLIARRISKVDSAITRLEATQYDGQGNVLKKTLETREYDSRRNLIKLLHYRWNADQQKFVPASAMYHHISYFY